MTNDKKRLMGQKDTENRVLICVREDGMYLRLNASRHFTSVEWTTLITDATRVIPHDTEGEIQTPCYYLGRSGELFHFEANHDCRMVLVRVWSSEMVVEVREGDSL